MKPRENNYLVTKSNDLINARYCFNLIESRLFLLTLSQVDLYAEKLTPSKIYIKDFLELSGAKTSAYYGDVDVKQSVNQMKKILKDLMTKVIEIKNKEGRPKMFVLITAAEYKKDESGVFVEIHLNDFIKPDLLDLKKHFTSYDLRNILPCRSHYSIRLYQLLKQYEKIGVREEFIENIKYMLECENLYKNYYDFKNRVILKAQEELKKVSDLYFDFEETEKLGKKVTKIRFLIYKQHQKQIMEIKS